MNAEFKNIAIKDYNYVLPDEKIAKYPKESRDESKLLYAEGNRLETYQFKQLPDILENSDLLIFNNARVIQARLEFFKETGAHIEIFCLEPHHPADYNLAFQVTDTCTWKCLVGNLKRWKNNKLQKKICINQTNYTIEATKISKTSNAEIIQFNWQASAIQSDNSKITFGDILENIGNTPLPPYLNRKAEFEDKTRYQTIYAAQEGSVAAPTAGLHFTENVLRSLKNKGIGTETITLHVSAGTFRPVKSQTIEGHEMHMEHFQINDTALKRIIDHKGRIIAVGTTSARTLESLHRIGLKLMNQEENPFEISQWEVYEKPDNTNYRDSFNAIINYLEINNLRELQASTSIIIIPGYQFKVIQGLITNFHQPKSTLLLLIAAAVGEKWREIYNYTLANDYRFLSYGDSSLLII